MRSTARFSTPCRPRNGGGSLDWLLPGVQHPFHLPSKLAPPQSLGLRISNLIQAVLAARLPAVVGFVLALSAVYLLTTSRERPWTDGSFVYFTAERLVTAGTTNLPFAAVATPSGHMQSPHPLLVSLVHVPGVIVKLLWTKLWHGGESHLLVLASHLAPAVLMAGTCWLFLQMCLFVGVRRGTSFLCTAMLAFGSIVWVYARSPWPPAPETFVFTGLFYAALRMIKHPTDRTAMTVGLWAAALVNVRWSFIVVLPPTGLWLVWQLRDNEEGQSFLAKRTLPIVLIGYALMFVESRWRFGDWSYWWNSLAAEPMKQGIFMGLWSLLLSPGKSFLIYSPPLVLGFFGIAHLWRRGCFEILGLLFASVAPVLLYLSMLNHWTGDWCWGPRYCIFLTPALMVPGAIVIDHWLRLRPWLALVPVVLAFGLGLCIQSLGNALYWDHYIRVAKQARIAWLGVPNRSGSLNHVTATECDPCFEDIYPMTWLAPFNPIEGHWWLLQHVWKGDDAVAAEKDAAWHRYTWLTLPIVESYPRARTDWWFLNFVPKKWGKGVGSLVGLVTLCGLGIWLWRRAPDLHATPDGSS